MRYIQIILLSFLLLGCAKDQIAVDSVVIHPEIPRPIGGFNTRWEIIEYNNTVYVGTEYSSFIEYLKHNYDVLRYIQQLNKTVCFYRSNLNETICTLNKEEIK